MRHLLKILVAVVFFGVPLAAMPTLALGQAQAPIIKNSAGRPIEATGTFCVNADGTACTFGGGSSGAASIPQFNGSTIQSSTVTASASSFTVVAANANRVGIAIQPNVACKISETGATLTSASAVSGEGGVRITAADGLYVPQGASTTAYTAYCTGAGLITYTQYLKP